MNGLIPDTFDTKAIAPLRVDVNLHWEINKLQDAARRIAELKRHRRQDISDEVYAQACAALVKGVEEVLKV